MVSKIVSDSKDYFYCIVPVKLCKTTRWWPGTREARTQVFVVTIICDDIKTCTVAQLPRDSSPA